MVRFWVLLIGLALLVGLGVRVFLAQSTLFWLDEILSYDLARLAGSPLGVFTSPNLKHDNNHHLNTLWLTLCPELASWWRYRLLSILAGTASIALAAVVARFWGRADAAFAALLFAGSYWMVLASIEARGYALVILFALAAFFSLRRYLDQRTWPWLLAFWLTCCLAFLSHLTFLHAYLGLLVWSLRRFAQQRQRPFDELKQLVVCHAGIAVFFAPFYLLLIRGMHIEGGPKQPWLVPLERLLTVGLAVGSDSPANRMYLGLFFLLFGAGLWILSRQEDDSWNFFAVCVFAAPALVLLREQPMLFERYLYVPFAFFLLLLAHLLATLWRRAELRRGSLSLLFRVVVVLFIGKFLWFNASYLLALHRGQRGDLIEALTFLNDTSQGGVVVVTGDDDFRIRKCLEFHARYFDDNHLSYRDNKHADEAEWLLVHRLNREDPVHDVLTVYGTRFRLTWSLPARGPEAWGWFIYRKLGPAE